jgi:hypothetical protein
VEVKYVYSNFLQKVFIQGLFIHPEIYRDSDSRQIGVNDRVLFPVWARNLSLFQIIQIVSGFCEPQVQ